MPKQPKVHLFDHSPHLRGEWDYNKNTDIDPLITPSMSNKKVWWVCGKGHSFEGAISLRTSRGVGCAYCSGNKVLCGFNDIWTTHPTYAEELASPDVGHSVSAGSGQPLEWACKKCNNTWKTPAYNRIGSQRGCPYCAGQRVMRGYNDLNTVDPEVGGELANPDIGYELTAGSGKKVEWVCAKYGHRWFAAVCDRTGDKKRGCPVCSGKSIQIGYNDLQTTHPHLAKELVDINLGTSLSKGSPKKVLWCCSLGHSWSASVRNRASGNRSTGCPYCCGKSTLVGFNDLWATAPSLASELTNPKLGYEVTKGSNRKLEWCCERGHVWVAAVVSRAGKGKVGCPYCAGNLVILGETDLFTLYPELQLEWDFNKNTENPAKVPAQSNKQIWWICAKGHSWATQVCNRTNGGTGCPKCSLQQTSRAEGILRSALAKTYHISSLHHSYRVPVPYRKSKSMSVDICLFSPRETVCEYDGSYFHAGEKSLNRDLDKTKALLDAGYLVVRVREQSTISLENLPLSHPNLLQLSVEYSRNDGPILEAVDQIKQWLESKND